MLLHIGAFKGLRKNKHAGLLTRARCSDDAAARHKLDAKRRCRSSFKQRRSIKARRQAVGRERGDLSGAAFPPESPESLLSDNSHMPVLAARREVAAAAAAPPAHESAGSRSLCAGAATFSADRHLTHRNAEPGGVTTHWNKGRFEKLRTSAATVHSPPPPSDTPARKPLKAALCIVRSGMCHISSRPNWTDSAEPTQRFLQSEKTNTLSLPLCLSGC